MAVHFCVFILLAVFSTVSPVRGGFGVKPPWPENQYPIEYTSAQVTCVAYDDNGYKIPDRILFVRKNKTGSVYVSLKANENIYFTTRKENNGTKLSVTLHIRNVTVEDDTHSRGPLGDYRCRAYAVGEAKLVQHGFSISVIRRNEIPKLETNKVGVLQHGDNATIHCNMTDRGSRASKLRKMSWLKNGKMVDSVEGPEKIAQGLSPLVIENANVEHGGNYTCVMEVVFRRAKTYNTSHSTFVGLEPWFETKEDLLEASIIGKDIRLPCSARGGFPLRKVEWKFQKANDEKVTVCLDSSSDQRFNTTRNGLYEPHSLSITNLTITDLGSYYCCLPSNCSNRIDKERCQRIKLVVIDPRSDATMTLVSRAVLQAMVFFAGYLLSF